MSENEPHDHEADAPITEHVELYDVGAGYLAIRIRREHHPEFGKAFPVDSELFGVVAVEDWNAVRAVLDDFGFEDMDDLPEFSCDDLTE